MIVAAAGNAASSTPWTSIALPVTVAAITAIVAVGGYMYVRRNQRRDDLRAVFSAALQSIAEYQELPYLIRRRSAHSPLTPSEVAARANDVQTRLDYYAARLHLESRALGEAYATLVDTVRSEAGRHMSEAWHQPRVSSDAEMALGFRYPRDQADLARAHCIHVMQHHLGIRLPG